MNDKSETDALETIPVIGKLTCWKSFLAMEYLRVFHDFSLFFWNLISYKQH